MIDTAQRPAPVFCPHCLDQISFDPTRLVARSEAGTYDRVDLSRETSPLRYGDALRGALQVCTNTPQLPIHYIPVPYLTSGKPVTVAMVGGSTSGKTHLLTAMLAAVERNGLDRFGVQTRWLNAAWHSRFVEERIEPLQSGRMLPHTAGQQAPVDFEDALLVRRAGVTRPVAFFDLAGEDLLRTDRGTRFLAAVDAFVFVVDPPTALRLARLDPVRARLGIGEVGYVDRTFGTVLDRIERHGELLQVPSVIVINKSDLIRFEPPVDRWLDAPPIERLDPRAIEAESRDAFAFLHRHGATPWLRPYLECDRSTLHFASATGGEATDSRFRPDQHARRVLEPLVSLFAMCGLLGDEYARAVGG
jgi:Double-GTPase 2